MTDPAMLDYATPQLRSPSVRGRGALAVAATWLLIGLGHWIAGARRRAIIWFAIAIAFGAIEFLCTSFAPAVPALLLLVPVGIVLAIAAWIDAYRFGHRSDRTMLRYPAARYLVAIACALIAIFFNPIVFAIKPVVHRVVESYFVPTASMSPTVVPGDRFLVHKLREFKRFDIVAISPGDPVRPNEMYIKRVVGFPGEKIELFNGGVKVNGLLIDPPSGAGPYVSFRSGPGSSRIRLADGSLGHGIEGNPITLGADEYFFLGDNSPISGDSRYWDWSVDGHQPGTLPRTHINGVATWIYWPPSRWRKLY